LKQEEGRKLIVEKQKKFVVGRSSKRKSIRGTPLSKSGEEGRNGFVNQTSNLGS